METIRVVRTVYPDNRPKDFNEWSMWFWGMYKIEMEKTKMKTSWDRNIYIPKKQ